MKKPIATGLLLFLLFTGVLANANTQIQSASQQDPLCRAVRDLVRITSIQYGVPANVMDVESMRQVGDNIITRYSVVMSPPVTPEGLFEAISKAMANAGFTTKTELVSETRLLITVYAEKCPCVEMLCVLSEPLPETSQSVILSPETAEEIEHLAPEKLPEPVEETPEPVEETPEPVEETPEPVEETPEPVEYPEPTEKEIDVTEVLAEGETISEEEMSEAESAADLPPGKIAIILDDGGYGGTVTTRVLELDNRIALAILPDTPFAESTAESAVAGNFDIMLHMPMQTSNNNNVHHFPGELTLEMTKEEIQTRTRECIEQFPDAVGVNNHTGAAFTMDEERLTWFLETVKEYGLFFVDSRTTWKSRAYDVAVVLGIPCGRREIFLDNSSDPDEIRKYLDELIQRARKHGSAIGIGHFRINTVTVLEEELPKLETKNIELVRISEMVK